LENKNYNQFYCRIEVACCLKIFLPEFKEEQCLLSGSHDVYAREFNDIESTLACIYEIEKTWEIAQEIEQRNISNIYGGNECASAMIYNHWGNMLDIEMYSKKWRLSDISMHTQEWKENIIQNKINFKSSRSLVAYIPCLHEVEEDEFISKERVIELIIKWLETDDIFADFDGAQCLAYMKEIWG
jgi:hypothetical protein